MLFFRSLLFNAVFYVNLIAFMVLGCFFYVTPRAWSMAALQTWARSSLWWLKVIAGTRVEVRGKENLPQGAALRLYGTASVVEDSEVTNDVYDRMCEREQKADSGRKGHAAMIAVDRITNLRGDDV